MTLPDCVDDGTCRAGWFLPDCGASDSYPGLTGEFETCPDWAPAMDTGQRFTRITLKTMRVDGFHHRANWVVKVRNVSRLGTLGTGPTQ
jgi:hypothetical protein